MSRSLATARRSAVARSSAARSTPARSTPARSAASRVTLTAATSLAVLGTLAACAPGAEEAAEGGETTAAAESTAEADETTSAAEETTEAGEATTEGATTEAAESSTYADGTYTATGSYVSPGGQESVEVELTLTGDVVTDVTVTSLAVNPNSERYQGEFVDGIADVVVGVAIDDLNVSKVAGSSLTSGGFNDAVEQIKAEARA